MRRFPVASLAIHLMVLTWIAVKVSLIMDKTYSYTYVSIYYHKFTSWLLQVTGYTILMWFIGRLLDAFPSSGKDRDKFS